MAKITIEHLWKVFGEKHERAIEERQAGKTKNEVMQDTGQVVALSDISLRVSQGEIFVIMGLSGSGKSTLLRCVNRLIEPTRGTVQLDDTEITALSDEELQQLRRNVLGMVFQRFALFPHMTVLENAVFGLEAQGAGKKERRERGKQVLRRVGLEGWEDSTTGSLSGGMQQRVGLARALAIDPEVLLMDEPFSALDPLIRSNLQEELLRLQEEMHKTVLFVTHDLNEAIKVGDRIAIMNSEGEVVQVGTPGDIVQNPADDYVKRFLADLDHSKLKEHQQ